MSVSVIFEAMKCNCINDYELNSVSIALPRIWMSFFVTEEAHAIVLVLGADRGGRAAPQGLPSSPPMDYM